MAENLTLQSATLATVASGVSIATDNVAGVSYQRVKIAVGDTGTVTDMTSAAPVWTANTSSTLMMGSASVIPTTQWTVSVTPTSAFSVATTPSSQITASVTPTSQFTVTSTPSSQWTVTTTPSSAGLSVASSTQWTVTTTPSSQATVSVTPSSQFTVTTTPSTALVVSLSSGTVSPSTQWTVTTTPSSQMTVTTTPSSSHTVAQGAVGANPWIAAQCVNALYSVDGVVGTPTYKAVTGTSGIITIAATGTSTTFLNTLYLLAPLAANVSLGTVAAGVMTTLVKFVLGANGTINLPWTPVGWVKATGGVGISISLSSAVLTAVSGLAQYVAV